MEKATDSGIYKQNDQERPVEMNTSFPLQRSPSIIKLFAGVHTRLMFEISATLFYSNGNQKIEMH